jgi:putative nucleotidyltransferase with HDIG domain
MGDLFTFHKENLDPEIRANVKKTLVYLDENMKDRELYEKVLDAWTLSLQLNGWKAIEEMPGSGMPEASALGDQSNHILVVIYTSMSIYRNLKKAYNMDFGLNEDMLMACAALHDVGKPYEYNRELRPQWVANDKEFGLPNLRHPSYGVFIAGVCGLPQEVLNVCGYHSPEGRFIKRCAYGEIVHYADDGSWFPLARLCSLNIPKL